MQFWTVEEISRHAMADHEPETELAPGVVLHRRAILQFGLGAAGLAAWPSGLQTGAARWRQDVPVRQDSPAPDPNVTLAALVADLHPRSLELIRADLPDEAGYLHAVRTLLARIRLEPAWDMHAAGAGWSMNTCCWMPPLVIFTIRMEPGSAMQLHDHRHYNGVLLCTAGSVRCRNFEYLQDDRQPFNVAAGEVPPAGTDFLIRQTRDEWLQPRAMSSLTRDRDNLHAIEAGPDGCELVDLFTHFRPEARSHELDWDQHPVDAAAQTFKASWRREGSE